MTKVGATECILNNDVFRQTIARNSRALKTKVPCSKRSIQTADEHLFPSSTRYKANVAFQIPPVGFVKRDNIAQSFG